MSAGRTGSPGSLRTETIGGGGHMTGIHELQT